MIRPDAEGLPGERDGPTSRTATVPRPIVDVERRAVREGDTLRLRSLSEPGWGRLAVGSGPHQSRCGRAANLELLNGHNGSELSVRWPSPAWYLYNHLLGTRGEPVASRVIRRLRGGGRLTLGDQLLRLARHRHATKERPFDLDVSLAFGWLGPDLDDEPLGGGHGFVVRAREAVNADLCAMVARRPVPVVEELQNVRVAVGVVLRDRGALLCVDGALLGGRSGTMRPIALDPGAGADRLWAGVHQSVSGQFGWTADSRVGPVAVLDRPEMAEWCTTAVLADDLTGSGVVTDRRPTRGPDWQTTGSDVRRSARGGLADRGDTLALLDAGEDIALVHADLGPDATGGLVVRAGDAGNGWVVWLDRGRVVADRRRDGVTIDRRQPPHPAEVPSGPSSLQVIDDGRRMQVVLDGTTALTLPSEGDGTGIGLAASTEVALQGFLRIEAHPTSIDPPRLPTQLDHRPRRGALVIRDDLTGPGRLAGRAADDRTWTLAVRTRPGDIVPDDHGARVHVEPESASKIVRNLESLVRPAAGRIAYTVPWDDPEAVGVSAEIVPPGGLRGEGHRGRGGLILWQDSDNYVVVSTWLDDAYAGASLSSFYRIDGCEELFDAIWTNVGSRVRWGRPYRLDLDYQAGWFQLRLDGEPVLERSIQDVVAGARLEISGVGVAANWEFGNDTGSTIRAFSAHRLLPNTR